jgi:hypothetical protein
MKQLTDTDYFRVIDGILELSERTENTTILLRQLIILLGLFMKIYIAKQLGIK